MRPTERPPELRSPPRDFDRLVEWFERISSGLVLLEEYPRDDVRATVELLDHAVRAHVRRFDARWGGRGAAPGGSVELRAILDADHARFLVSVEQLRWFFRIVESEDHGGHRQALGQYGRVLAEALRRHRRDERSYLAGVRGTRGRPAR